MQSPVGAIFSGKQIKGDDIKNKLVKRSKSGLLK